MNIQIILAYFASFLTSVVGILYGLELNLQTEILTAIFDAGGSFVQFVGMVFIIISMVTFSVSVSVLNKEF